MKRSAKTQSLYDLIAPAVAACGVDLWGIEFLQQGRRSLLRIYIDKADSDTADEALEQAVPEAVDSSEAETTDVLAAEEEQGRGIGVEDCVKVTHQVGAILDVHDPIAGEYALEVSSPGWDRQFFELSQLQGYIGQTIALRLISPVLNRRKLTARLVSVAEQGLVVDAEGQTLTLDAGNIDKAHLVYQDQA